MYTFCLRLQQTFFVEAGYAIGEVSDGVKEYGGYFREPANALSNLGFITTGLIMFGFWHEKTKKIGLWAYSYCITVRLGSIISWTGFFAYAWNTYCMGQADWLSMIMYISIPWLVNVFVIKNYKESSFVKVYLYIVGVYGLLSWLFGTGLGINFNFWALSIALWVITEVLQNYNSKTVRYLSGFVGIAVMSVFGIFPDQVILNFSEYWWVVLFWLPALILDEKSPVKKNYFPWYWAGVGFYIFQAFLAAG